MCAKAFSGERSKLVCAERNNCIKQCSSLDLKKVECLKIEKNNNQKTHVAELCLCDVCLLYIRSEQRCRLAQNKALISHLHVYVQKFDLMLWFKFLNHSSLSQNVCAYPRDKESQSSVIN